MAIIGNIPYFQTNPWGFPVIVSLKPIHWWAWTTSFHVAVIGRPETPSPNILCCATDITPVSWDGPIKSLENRHCLMCLTGKSSFIIIFRCVYHLNMWWNDLTWWFGGICIYIYHIISYSYIYIIIIIYIYICMCNYLFIIVYTYIYIIYIIWFWFPVHWKQ